MNTSQGGGAEGGSSSVVVKSENVASSSSRHRTVLLPAPAIHIPGFASIVNLKDDSCTVTTRGGGRRIKITSRIGVAAPQGLGGGSGDANVALAKSLLNAHEIGPAAKRRWSFHSSSQINELFKADKVLKPISPNKRRKSCGVALAEPTEITPSTSEDTGQGHKAEQSRSSKQQNVLTNKQLQGTQQRQHRRISTGRVVSLRDPLNDSLGSSRRERMRSEYLPRIDPYDLAFHHFRVIRRSKIREAPQEPDYLSTMPDEILLRVFKNLPKSSLANLGRTSHRFLKVIQDDSLWKRLCLMGKTLLPEHLHIIMARKPIYLRMARTWIPDPEEATTDIETLTTTSQLLYLDMTAAFISSSTLAFTMRISPKLEKLSLENLKLSKEVLLAMMGFTATIEVLNLSTCSDLDSKLYERFLLSCKKLRELNMGCMTCDWSHEDLTAIVCALPETVQQLNISGYRSVLDNSHIAIIVSRCPNIIELDISDSQELKGKTIEYMMRLPRLQHLGVSRCYGIEAPVYTLLAGHKSLQCLDLYSLFKESSLRHLTTSLPKIEINKFPFSAVARPTVGNKRSSIWLQRVRD